MDLFERIKKYESLHIVFWLVKDSCWMLELKWLGIVMVVPTLTIAAVIVYFTRKITDVYLNLAILCWICANSYWMFIEFFTKGDHKLLATFPFGLGFLFIGIFYYKILANKSKTT